MKLRKYQIEALKAIEDELIVNNSRKCLVKMFCGTGKSAIMRNFQKKQDDNLIVYVFPSLSLISQFTHDYLKKEKTPILKISSDDNSTTEPYIIQNFLSKLSNKIICVTYQSFATLIENLNGLIIDVCIFDEAHHAVGQTYQQLIFKDCEHSNKQIFFTATPKNANGIVMYEKDLISDCGKMVYDYTYYRGITEEYLNPFEIRLDFYTEHNNHSIYESICRSILASGNNRVLTFHSDVNTDRDTSVNNFVNQLDLDKAFNKILNEEFSEKIGFYTKVKIIGLSSSIVATCPQCLEKIKKSTHRPVAKSCCRYNILENFDKTEENEILIISSCETIGEGIDTKNANMCVFVDPKSSYVSIMQNIGRIVRKNGERPLSTILIPCWVDREKYLNCNEDKEKCDEAIREDLGAQGNFNQILNVMSALRQEDEELYDICLRYPDKNTPKRNLIENFKYLLDENIDYEEYEECETNEEILTQIADNYDVNIEVYTDVDETPTEIYTGYELEDESDDEEIKKTIKLHKTKNEDTEEIIYSLIVQEEGEKIIKQISSSDRKKRMNIKVHSDLDVKVLWNISNDVDVLKDVCSCVMDCEIVDKWYERLDELKRFIDENNKRPSTSKSKNDSEKQLGNWIQAQNTNYKTKKHSMKDVEKYNLWTQFLKDYEEYLKSNDDIWYENFDEVKRFIDENNKRPSTSKSKNDSEKQLGGWIQAQNTNYKNKKKSMKDVEKYKLWTQFLKDYEEYLKSNDDIWYEKFDELKRFIDENNKRPSCSSKNDSEKQLGVWIEHQNKNYKTKNYVMKDVEKYNLWTQFLKDYEEYLKSNDDIWYEKFDELKRFIDENNKRPSKTSKNDSEKQLGNWINTQNDNYKTKNYVMKDEIKYNLWTQFLKDYEEYLKSNDDIWYENFDEVKRFIDENNKRPSSRTSKNDSEKQLGGWIQNQNKNYKNKKKSMKDVEKYKLWTKFLIDNKDILNLKEDIIDYSVNIEDFEENLKEVDEEETQKDIIVEESEEEFDLDDFEIEELEPEPEPIVKKSAILQRQKVWPTKNEGENTQQPTTNTTKKERTECELTKYHRKFITMRSDNLAQHFRSNRDDFIEYHRIRDENLESFEQNDRPHERIIAELNKIKTKRQKLIVDMGCGLAKIAEYFKNDRRFQFINYDHVSTKENIIECDIKNMPLEDDSVEICIMSMALWGSNCEEYVTEAHRVLESGGKLYIIDSTKRWSEENKATGIIEEGTEGNRLKNILVEKSFQIINCNINKFCLFICEKV
jgi:superfamily II DNA or RNA helicase